MLDITDDMCPGRTAGSVVDMVTRVATSSNIARILLEALGGEITVHGYACSETDEEHDCPSNGREHGV
jgi:hypothetical protein